MPICIVGYGTSVSDKTFNPKETMQRITKAYESGYKNSESDLLANADKQDVLDFFNRLIKSTKIETRYATQKACDLEEKYNFQVPYTEKMNLWYDTARELVFKSCNESINDYVNNYNGNAKDITHVICHSVTGWHNPGMTHYIINKFQLSNNVRPIEANIAGCHGGTHLLYLATCVVNMDKNAVVLMVDCEVMEAPLCFPKINFNPQRKDKAEFVPLVLFGTGSGSLIIKHVNSTINTGPLWQINYEKQKSFIIPNTSNEISFHWDMNQNNNISCNVCVLSPQIPSKWQGFVQRQLGEYLADVYVNGFDCHKTDFAMHCGGKVLLDIVKKYLIKTYNINKMDDQNELLKYSYNIYKNYGNQSGTSILFVLKDVCKKTKKDDVFFMSMGTGITVQIGSLTKIQSHSTI